MRNRTHLLWAALLCCGCRTPAGNAPPPTLGEKGSVVPVRVDAARLDEAYAPRRFALLVGISALSDDRWRPLKYARKDAEDLAAVLQHPKRGHFDGVKVLSRPGETTRGAILNAVAALAKQATREDDTVLVYVSAHGTLARDEKGELRRYLVTQDADFRRVAETALPIDALKSTFDALPSHRRLLVLATCHSGAGKSLLPKEVEQELAGIKSGFYGRPIEQASKSAMVFSACDWGETAREDDELHNDIYTHYLVEALGGQGDRNLDGAVTATEAHDYARRRTFAFTGGRQRPSAEILEVGADPLVLSGSAERLGHPELYSYSPRLDGFTLQVDGEGRTELPGGAAVLEGKRHVELTKGGQTLVSEDVVLGSGERVDVESLLSRRTPHHALSLLGGGFGFVDAQSRAELLPPAAGVGLSLRFDDLPLPKLALVLDVEGSGGQDSLALAGSSPVPFTFASFTAGASVPYVFHWRRWRFFVGPRVAALWLHRSFSLSAYQGAQDYLTAAPGAMGGIVFLLTDKLELSAQANLMLTYVVVDHSGQALGFTGGWAGVGYRF